MQRQGSLLPQPHPRGSRHSQQPVKSSEGILISPPAVVSFLLSSDRHRGWWSFYKVISVLSLSLLALSPFMLLKCNWREQVSCCWQFVIYPAEWAAQPFVPISISLLTAQLCSSIHCSVHYRTIFFPFSSLPYQYDWHFLFFTMLDRKKIYYPSLCPFNFPAFPFLMPSFTRMGIKKTLDSSLFFFCLCASWIIRGWFTTY